MAMVSEPPPAPPRSLLALLPLYKPGMADSDVLVEVDRLGAAIRADTSSGARYRVPGWDTMTFVRACLLPHAFSS